MEEQSKESGIVSAEKVGQNTEAEKKAVIPSEREPGHTHVFAAISAIVDEDLEFFTPLEEVVDENRDTSLPNVTEEEEEEFYSIRNPSIPSSLNQGGWSIIIISNWNL